MAGPASHPGLSVSVTGQIPSAAVTMSASESAAGLRQNRFPQESARDSLLVRAKLLAGAPLRLRSHDQDSNPNHTGLQLSSNPRVLGLCLAEHNQDIDPFREAWRMQPCQVARADRGHLAPRSSGSDPWSPSGRSRRETQARQANGVGRESDGREP